MEPKDFNNFFAYKLIAFVLSLTSIISDLRFKNQIKSDCLFIKADVRHIFDFGALLEVPSMFSGYQQRVLKVLAGGGTHNGSACMAKENYSFR